MPRLIQISATRSASIRPGFWFTGGGRDFRLAIRPAVTRQGDRTTTEGIMQAPSESGSDRAILGSDAGQEWLGKSVWEHPQLEISRIKSWPSITAMSFRRGDGESIWRSDRHRIVLALDQLPPIALPGRARTHPANAACRARQSLVFSCRPHDYGSFNPRRGYVQVLWDTDLYSALLPELGAAASRFEFLSWAARPLAEPNRHEFGR